MNIAIAAKMHNGIINQRGDVRSTLDSLGPIAVFRLESDGKELGMKLGPSDGILLKDGMFVGAELGTPDGISLTVGN